MAKRSAAGAGSIRQRPDGRWEARYSAGRDPGTGRQIQKSVYADTQKECAEKLRRVLVEIDTGAFVEPVKLTVGAWLDIWTADYLGGVKASTQASYKGHIKNHIKPALGAVALQKLKPHQLQAFYNGLIAAGLSPKTVKNVHGVLHSAFTQAQRIGYTHTNVAGACTLPRWAKREMQVLDDEAVTAFIQAIQGSPYEAIYFFGLFTGLRQSEILGLAWDAVDFKTGTVTVFRQLVKERKPGGKYYLDTTKNDKVRRITPAHIVMEKLKERQRQQIEARLKAGPAWDNSMNLVFTNETGGHFPHITVYKCFKAIVAGLGRPALRFHDLRHSYAVAALANGDDVKTVQSSLGHHTAAFTLDTYAHVTEKMREDSAARMDAYIQRVMGGES